MRDLVLGRDNLWKRLVYLASDLRPRHLYILGKPGKGKSTLMHRLIYQDAKSKRPYAIVVFDAGDLATDVLESLPDAVHETRVAFFSVDHPIPYNPFRRRKDFAEKPARLKNELFALMDQVTAEGATPLPLTPRMRRLLSLAIEEVVKEPEPSFASLATYLMQKKTALRQALQLREEEFSATWDGVIDRLSTLLRDPRIRRVICARHELDFGGMIDSGTILLVSLAGLEPILKRLLGTLLFHGLQATILERGRAERRPVAIYVDEFHDYISSSYAAENFQVLFSQGRKYQASLCVAHTDFGQLPPRLLQTIHGTVGSMAAFSCGTSESVAMAHLFGEEYVPQTVAFQSDYRAITRVDHSVHSIETYPPLHKVRELLEDHGDHDPVDPPDPLAVSISEHDRDAYTTGRKPRRAAAGTRKG